MDTVNNFLGKATGNTDATQQQQQPAQSGGFMDKVNGALGGGAQGEQKEDYLDKVVDKYQEMSGGGAQNNESAVEQAKDEAISDTIRAQYKNATGNEFFVADK